MPLVLFEFPPKNSVACVKSPKSVALPIVANVIYCITSEGPLSPPAIRPRVGDCEGAHFF